MKAAGRVVIMQTLLWAVAVALTAAEARESDAAAAALEATTQLTKRFAESDAEVKKTVAAKGNVENKLAEAYADLQKLCKAAFDDLERDQQRYEAAESRTNVIGSALALIGSVTVYAPAKTVLMGLGISSSGSGTVSSGVTQMFSKKSATDKATLATLKNQLAIVFDHYDLLDETNDKSGARRSSTLTRGRNICLGLTPAVDPPPVPASGASAATS